MKTFTTRELEEMTVAYSETGEPIKGERLCKWVFNLLVKENENKTIHKERITETAPEAIMSLSKQEMTEDLEQGDYCATCGSYYKFNNGHRCWRL